MYPTTLLTAIQSANRPNSRGKPQGVPVGLLFLSSWCHLPGNARTASCRSTAVSRKPPSPYKCSFCSDRLEPLKFRGWRVILLIFPMRDFRCPHCFAVFSKPVAWIGRFLPSVSVPKMDAMSKRVRRANRTAANTSDTFFKRCLKLLSRLGKRVTDIEEFFGSGFKKCFAWLSPQAWSRRRRSSENSEGSVRRRSERLRSSRDHETSQTSKSSEDIPQSPS